MALWKEASLESVISGKLRTLRYRNSLGTGCKALGRIIRDHKDGSMPREDGATILLVPRRETRMAERVGFGLSPDIQTT
jgi:hypothetical protein